MLNILSRLPAFYFFRAVGRPRILPMNLTLSVSYSCNSRCKTCNIYKKRSDELSVDEWTKIFNGFGKGLFWATISGGEPFLRRDVTEIVCSLYDNCKPAIINIPTNGLLDDRIPALVKKIADHCNSAKIVVNVSVDEIGDRHDEIRGVPGSYARALRTFAGLKALQSPNLSVGIHTVISRFNVHRIPEIYRHLRELSPDSYITEIAEERKELDTIGSDITPEYSEYAAAVDFLSVQLRKDNFNSVGRMTRAFRLNYYNIVKRILREHRQVIPCYAGFASAQVAPDGDVWMCCVRAEPIGNLRSAGYNFEKVWSSEQARAVRSSIKRNDCHCPLANASYTNMLHDAASLARVGWNLISLRKT